MVEQNQLFDDTTLGSGKLFKTNELMENQKWSLAGIHASINNRESLGLWFSTTFYTNSLINTVVQIRKLYISYNRTNSYDPLHQGA